MHGIALGRRSKIVEWGLVSVVPGTVLRRMAMRNIVSIIVLAVFLGLGGAHAAEMTARDKAVFDMLSPQLQEQLKSRLTGGNTVRGVLETMLLNEISELFATNRILAVDFNKGVAIVERADGDVDTVYFDTTTLVIKK
jgi:hypothetical protein